MNDEIDERPEDGIEGADSESGGQEGRGGSAWVSFSRYLTRRRAEELVSFFDEAGIPTRIEGEGQADSDLYRVRVPVDRVESGEELLAGELPQPLPAENLPVPAGPFASLRRRRAAARARAEAASAIENNDREAAIDALWAITELDPSDTLALRELIDLITDSEAPDAAALARYRLEQVMRREGAGAVSVLMADVALAEGELDEAAAWIDEAGRSGAPQAEVTFAQCLLAFDRGDFRGLKNAASSFRRESEIPDANWIEVARLLAAAGDTEQATRMLGKVLRDADDISEDEWATGAALRMVIEGDDAASRQELAELLGEDAAEEVAGEAAELHREAKREWKKASAGGRGGRRR